MSAVFTIFLAKFVAPIPIVAGIVGAYVSRSWWHVLITALVAASISEIFLHMTKADYSFVPLVFMISVFAAGLWAAWFYWLRLAKLKSK